ncbi:MAG: hypothetical protein IPM82_20470 [Saprospiraceae bacterium]|nr:hypothetical protein [Saprospiraceae bacterium]
MATGSTNSANNDGPATSLHRWQHGPDVWYSIMGTGDFITASLCGGTDYDSKLDVYTGDCAALTSVACDDQYCQGNAQVTWLSVAGTAYRIRVHGYQGATGSFTLNVTCAGPPPPPSPANDLCANAYPIACGFQAIGSTVNAGIDGPATDCNGGSVAPDVWYTVTGTGDNIMARLCFFTNYDSKLDVYTGACGALTSVGCNDNYCGDDAQVIWPSVAGTTYLVRVHGFNGATGDYRLQVICNANDFCANAMPIACGGTATGSTAGASMDGPATTCNGGSVAPDYWYSITGTGDNITASLCGGTDYNSKLAIYTGACAALTEVACNDDFCGTNAQVTWASVAGTAYLIRVHGYLGATGNYTLDVTCAGSPPPSVELTCPTSTTVAACQTQTAVTNAFNNWLATASGTAAATAF